MQCLDLGGNTWFSEMWFGKAACYARPVRICNGFKSEALLKMFQLLVWHNKVNLAKPMKNMTSHF